MMTLVVARVAERSEQDRERDDFVSRYIDRQTCKDTDNVLTVYVNVKKCNKY